MFNKFADLSLDVASDPGFRKFASIVEEVGESESESEAMERARKKVKKYVSEIKELDILGPEDLGMLPDSDFALIHVAKDGKITRRFPMPDINNAIVSATYLMKTYKDMPNKASAIAANNLYNYIEVEAEGQCPVSRTLRWDITDMLREIINIKYDRSSRELEGNVYREPSKPDVENLRDHFDDETRNIKESRAKLADDDFVFVSEKDGQKRRLFPITSAEDVEKMASYFDKNHKQFSLEQRHTFAKKLRDKAAEYYVEIPASTVSKYASHEWSPTAYECIKTRIDQLKQYEVRYNEKTAEHEVVTKCDDERAQALVGYVKLSGLIGRTDIDKYAETLHMLDKVAGFDKGYGKFIRDPYGSTYKPAITLSNPRLEKVANTLDSLATTFMGKPVKANDLMNLNAGDLGGLIDQGTLDEMVADPIAVFNSLPIPYKSVIVEAIGSKGK